MTDGQIKTHPKVDLTGKTINKLIVLRQGPDYVLGERRQPQWYCKCSCGNPDEILVLGQELNSGKRKSCGCALKDVYANNNKYDLTGEYGICTMADGNKFLFDLEDYDKIKNHVWHIVGHGYVGCTINYHKNEKSKHKNLMLHRYIMGVDSVDWEIQVVDHINGDVLDNRKCNLRLGTQEQNSYNQKTPKNNNSGVKGVYYYKKNKKWGVKIRINGSYTFLGLFENFEDAVKVRKEAEDLYYGEWSYDNSQKINNAEESSI